MRYGDVQALDGMSWTAAQGQVTVLLGPNGAGKTTCVEIAEGLRRADSGRVRVLGRDPWRADAEHRARVGIMLQDAGLPQNRRARALLRHLARFYTDPMALDDLDDRLDLAELDRSTIRRLSHGQRQRLGLAAALIGRPDVLFLDEPTAGVDPHLRRQIWALLTEQAARGVSVVLATHSFEEAERLGDQVVVVSGGRTLVQGTLAQVASGGSLEDAYFQLTEPKAGA